MRNSVIVFFLMATLNTLKAETTISSTLYRAAYTRKIDLIDTKLDLSFDFDSCLVKGNASILLYPYSYPINSIQLDARFFDIHSVMLDTSQGSIQAKYQYDGEKITIDLGQFYTSQDAINVNISYTAKPEKLQIGQQIKTKSDRGFYFIKTDKKTPMFWTQGETECNSNWFPTVNDPQEKMTQEIALTIDKKFVTLSNGLLVSSKMVDSNNRKDVWRQNIPHSTYLTMIAAGIFSKTVDRWRDIEVSYYLEPEYAPFASLIFGNTPEMIEFFSNKLGIAFPWDKYSQMVVREFVSGAMENTSASIFYEKMNLTPEEYAKNSREFIIAHELFHQWFGDLVTCESWSNLPLNESFANYGECLWSEYKYGRSSAEASLLREWKRYLEKSAKTGQKELIRPHYEHRDDMFDVFSYQKGGAVIHYLRTILGDEIFFKGLNTYLKKNAYKTAEIHDLRMAFELESGMDLNWFFEQWFFKKGHPQLTITSQYDTASKTLLLYCLQTQSAEFPVYKLPFKLAVYNQNSQRKDFDLEINAQQQTITISMENAPKLIVFDSESAVPCEKTETKTLQEYFFMYQNMPTVAHKVEALRGILNWSKDNLSKEAEDFLDTVKENFFKPELLYLNISLIESLVQYPIIGQDIFLGTMKKMLKSEAINPRLKEAIKDTQKKWDKS